MEQGEQWRERNTGIIFWSLEYSLLILRSQVVVRKGRVAETDFPFYLE